MPQEAASWSCLCRWSSYLGATSSFSRSWSFTCLSSGNVNHHLLFHCPQHIQNINVCLGLNMLKFNTGNYWDGSVRRIELSFGLHKFIGSSKKEKALVWAFSGHYEML